MNIAELTAVAVFLIVIATSVVNFFKPLAREMPKPFGAGPGKTRIR